MRMLFAFLTCAALSLPAQQSAAPVQPAAPPDSHGGFHFRNLGPAVAGGRITAVVGVPGQPRVYYAGSAAGGIFKSENAGETWKPIFEHEPISAIGAIDLAPSNPNLVWVGTGEANPRNDVSDGRGVYFSPDAGATWQFMGLAEAGQIAKIIVSPANPDIVLVGVTGDAWGPSAIRGVFRTIDGGKTWTKVLYVDEITGVSDMAVDPENPMVVYAGMWPVQRHPWELISGGSSGGIFRSVDGGATWKKLIAGLPKAPTGRVGLAIAPSNPRHIYAEIESKEGVLWESRDMGEHWTKVSENMLLDARPWYFCRIAVAPNNEEKVYFLSFDLLLSPDGGHTERNIGSGVHADHHAIWIDPTNPNRIIEGNDGGVYISWDAGENWHFADGLPVEQFYSVALDGRTPYGICGGIQDNSGWCGPSQTLSPGNIANGEWWTTIYGDGQYVVPAGDMIYSDFQNGEVQALNRETGKLRQVRPYVPTIEEIQPSDLKYRFNWTAPIAVAPGNPKEVYLGGNVLFKSLDAGDHWQVVSPDLTRNDKSKQVLTGGPIAYDLSGAESYDTLLSIAICPQDPNVIWTGSDDGMVHVTRDGGKTWNDVSPQSAPEWGRISQVEVSPFAAGTAYVAVDRHEMNDRKPYVFKTHDFGRTWMEIDNGIPSTDPAHVVREDPNQRGLLVLGTEAALYYSSDEGGHWLTLQSDLATTPIYDMKFQKTQHDLVVATHGRGLWVLDDISPLEQSAAHPAGEQVVVYHPVPANHWNMFNRYGRSLSFHGGEWSAANRPVGMFIDYSLPKPLTPTPVEVARRESPVRITITDSTGAVVRTIWGTSKAGPNRVLWDLTYDGPARLVFMKSPTEQWISPLSKGPLVMPGEYKIAVTVTGSTYTTSGSVSADPRFPFDAEAFKARAEVALRLRDELDELNQALNREAELRAQISAIQRILTVNQSGSNTQYAALRESAHKLDQRLASWQEPLFNSAIENDSKYYLHYLARLHDRLTRLANEVQAGYDTVPSAAIQEELTALHGKATEAVNTFNSILTSDVAAFNRMAAQSGVATLFGGHPVSTAASKPAGE